MREAEIILPNMRGASATSDNRVHLLLRMTGNARKPAKSDDVAQPRQSSPR